MIYTKHIASDGSELCQECLDTGKLQTGEWCSCQDTIAESTEETISRLTKSGYSVAHCNSLLMVTRSELDGFWICLSTRTLKDPIEYVHHKMNDFAVMKLSVEAMRKRTV